MSLLTYQDNFEQMRLELITKTSTKPVSKSANVIVNQIFGIEYPFITLH